MELKQFYLCAGAKGNKVHTDITLDGVFMGERLTPKLAIRAALVAFGHRSGVRVSDGAQAYQVYANTVRKLRTEQGNDDL